MSSGSILVVGKVEAEKSDTLHLPPAKIILTFTQVGVTPLGKKYELSGV